MNVLILCFSLSVLAAASHGYVVEPLVLKEHELFLSELRYAVDSVGDDEILVSVVNAYLDKFLNNAVNLIKTKGYDPMQVKPVSKARWWGHVDLAEIQLDGLASLHRSSDSEVKYNRNTKHMKIELPLALDDLTISATYTAKLFGLGPSGNVTGEIKGLAINAIVDIDMDKGGAIIEKFQIDKDGKINIEFQGHAFMDRILNTMVNAVSFLFDGVIVDSVNRVVKNALQDLVDILDKLLAGMLKVEEGLTLFHAMIVSGSDEAYTTINNKKYFISK
ncbi:hypothetical protein WA026_016995 [Henosepilachna vigintioctopunctata]|uniref:Uncharacterized protein n=1 Tax=Henosepilachna vigintioctopunctata TaxID=420089 RepID=A0AAW1U9A1_9CUCU